jgi:hypothetical protein
LIQRLEQLINDSKTDELHELQPLFERGLWIFGPELEGPQFMSNRALATIVREFFGGGTVEEPRDPFSPDDDLVPRVHTYLVTGGLGDGSELCEPNKQHCHRRAWRAEYTRVRPSRLR